MSTLFSWSNLRQSAARTPWTAISPSLEQTTRTVLRKGHDTPLHILIRTLGEALSFSHSTSYAMNSFNILAWCREIVASQRGEQRFRTLVRVCRHTETRSVEFRMFTSW